MSVSTQATFETGHTDQIHDCQYDYYGRVRAASSRGAAREADSRPTRAPPSQAASRSSSIHAARDQIRTITET